MTRPCAPSRICIPFDQWPHLDRSAYTAAVEMPTVFMAGGAGAHWRPATRRRYIGAWGRYLRFLKGTDLNWTRVSPEARLKPETIDRYITFLRSIGLTAVSLSHEIEALHHFAWRVFPGGAYNWLSTILGRLMTLAKNVPPTPMRLVPIHQLLNAGTHTMQQAEKFLDAAFRPGNHRHPALAYRDGLMVALLSVTLLRRSNFGALAIGTALRAESGGYRVMIPAHETKNNRPIEFEVYPPLTPFVDTYIHKLRPLLLAGKESSALWISYAGQPMRGNAVAEAIARITVKHFGIPLPMHRFRHCAATSIAELHPDLARIIQPLLSHRTPTTAERFYNKAAMLASSRRYGLALEAVRTRVGDK